MEKENEYTQMLLQQNKDLINLVLKMQRERQEAVDKLEQVEFILANEGIKY